MFDFLLYYHKSRKFSGQILFHVLFYQLYCIHLHMSKMSSQPTVYVIFFCQWLGTVYKHSPLHKYVLLNHFENYHVLNRNLNILWFDNPSFPLSLLITSWVILTNSFSKEGVHLRREFVDNYSDDLLPEVYGVFLSRKVNIRRSVHCLRSNLTIALLLTSLVGLRTDMAFARTGAVGAATLAPGLIDRSLLFPLVVNLD